MKTSKQTNWCRLQVVISSKQTTPKNGNLNWQNFLGRQIQSFKKQNNPENTENK